MKLLFSFAQLSEGKGLSISYVHKGIEWEKGKFEQKTTKKYKEM